MDIEPSCVVPGDVIGSKDQYLAGEGTFIRGSSLRAAVAGFTQIQQNEQGKPTISVSRVNQKPLIVPQQGSIVIGKVTKVNPRQATIKIVCVGDVPLMNDFPAIIRQHDVRQTQVDEVEIYKCFRPGDIVRAEVISLGDKKSYYLSTAKNEYGVIFAKSVADAAMIPISWDLMQCPKTKMTEHRKVAKVQ